MMESFQARKVLWVFFFFIALLIPLSGIQWETGAELVSQCTLGLFLETQATEVKKNMGKFSCCVPRCTNNWRNSPDLKFHSLPQDPKVLSNYVKLIRNDNLKVHSSSTKICGKHFPQGERMCRTQLPSIFPWSKAESKRRDLVKHAVPLKRKRRKPSATKSFCVELHDVEEQRKPKDQEDRTDQVHTGSEKEEDNVETFIIKDLKAKLESLEKEFEECKQKLCSANKELDQYLKYKLEIEKEFEECKQQLCSANKELDQLKHKLENDPKFELNDYKDNDESISFYTGFPSYATMILCFDTLKAKAENLSYGGHERVDFINRKSGRKRKLSLWQEYTLVLLRLRLGLLEKDLADRYRVSVTTVSDIFITWIKFMKLELYPLCIVWPSKEQLKFYMPAVFKELYPELVSIIDCTEIHMESPSSLDKQAMCYSSYKSHTTMKSLLGITPNGAVSFVSELYSGSISDPEIVKKSGYLDYVQSGDLIMADKGFLIQDQLAAKGASLVIPNFLSSKNQFSKSETEENKKVASLRIHVERYMERLKNWHFFDRSIPIAMASTVSDAWIVVACLSNFWPPIIG